MTWYLGYATAGHEFEVADALAFAGFDVWCGRVTERVKGQRRSPKRGRKEAFERVEVSPALPNYIFLNLDSHEFYAAHAGPLKYRLEPDGTANGEKAAVPTKNVRKYLRSTMLVLTPKAVREFQIFRARIENMDVIDKMQPGARLEITEGFLESEMATLKAIAGDRVEVELDIPIGASKISLPIDHVTAAE